MSREEAINILNDYDINFERHTAEEVAEAHEMSIEALKAQPSEDCISRDATLTAFSDYVGGGMSMNDFDAMWDIVVKMPPVEPKPKTSEDCISRKAVLDGLASIAKAKAKSDSQKSLMGRVMFFTEHLPSVTPQPKEHTEERTETHEKTGHWEWVQYESKPNFGNWHCSECRYILCGAIKGNSVKLPKYCSECGAKMQEVKK